MALGNFSTINNVVTVNGRQISDWGEDANPITEEPIDQSSNLRRGYGGSAVRLDRINPGRRVTLNINPGSPDAAYLQGLFMSRANITYTRTVIGSLENVLGSEGVMTNDGTVQRGGVTISDDQFIFEFNVWEGLKGGEG